MDSDYIHYLYELRERSVVERIDRDIRHEYIV